MSTTKEGTPDARKTDGVQVPASSLNLVERFIEMHKKEERLSEKLEQLEVKLKEAEIARDRYRKKASGEGRDTFVLVLVDGDGCGFEESLVKKGAEGGRQAADLINQIVKRQLSDHDHHKCNIVVRVYGNVAGLSKTLHQAELCGLQDFAAFTVGFTETQPLSDFIDSGTSEHSTRLKIQAAIRHHAALLQCRHIYFVGCHNTAYIKDLTPYASHKHRFTLIETPKMREKFQELGFTIARFPGVFRDKPLVKVSTRRLEKTISPSGVQADKRKQYDDGPAMKKVDPKPCAFFAKGLCKFGDKCHHSHIAGPRSSQVTRIPGIDRDLRLLDWRMKQEEEKAVPLREQAIPLRRRSQHKVAELIRGSADVRAEPTRRIVDFEKVLIHDDHSKAGYVLVNADGYRLDSYLTPPSKRTLDEFTDRHEPKHLCNHFHLTGRCEHGSDCDYDHAPISNKLREVLRMKARSSPCRKKGACRLLSCINGHICQLQDCVYRGGETKCKMTSTYHLEGTALKARGYARGETDDYQKPRVAASTRSISDDGFVSPASPGIDTPSEPTLDAAEALIDFSEQPAMKALTRETSIKSFLSLPIARSRAGSSRSI